MESTGTPWSRKQAARVDLAGQYWMFDAEQQIVRKQNELLYQVVSAEDRVALCKKALASAQEDVKAKKKKFAEHSAGAFNKVYNRCKGRQSTGIARDAGRLVLEGSHHVNADTSKA